MKYLNCFVSILAGVINAALFGCSSSSEVSDDRLVETYEFLIKEVGAHLPDSPDTYLINEPKPLLARIATRTGVKCVPFGGAIEWERLHAQYGKKIAVLSVAVSPKRTVSEQTFAATIFIGPGALEEYQIVFVRVGTRWRLKSSSLRVAS